MTISRNESFKIIIILILTAVNATIFYILKHVAISIEIAFLSVIAAILTVYVIGSYILLSDFSKRLFNEKIRDIENINDDNVLNCSIDIAKFNIQTFHSLLTMMMLITALSLSLHSLYNSLGFNIDAGDILSIVLPTIGIIFSVGIITFRWYKIYNELMDIKLRLP